MLADATLINSSFVAVVTMNTSCDRQQPQQQQLRQRLQNSRHLYFSRGEKAHRVSGASKPNARCVNVYRAGENWTVHANQFLRFSRSPPALSERIARVCATAAKLAFQRGSNSLSTYYGRAGAYSTCSPMHASETSFNSTRLLSNYSYERHHLQNRLVASPKTRNV